MRCHAVVGHAEDRRGDRRNWLHAGRNLWMERRALRSSEFLAVDPPLLMPSFPLPDVV